VILVVVVASVVLVNILVAVVVIVLLLLLTGRRRGRTTRIATSFGVIVIVVVVVHHDEVVAVLLLLLLSNSIVVVVVVHTTLRRSSTTGREGTLMRERNINRHAIVRASRKSLGCDLFHATSDAPVTATGFVEAQGTAEDLEVGMIREGELFILDLATTLDALLLTEPGATERTDASCSTICSC